MTYQLWQETTKNKLKLLFEGTKTDCIKEFHKQKSKNKKVAIGMKKPPK